jgi:hypothetical protein
MRAELSSTPGIIIFVFHLPSLSLSKNYRVCVCVHCASGAHALLKRVSVPKTLGTCYKILVTNSTECDTYKTLGICSVNTNFFYTWCSLNTRCIVYFTDFLQNTRHTQVQN